MIFGFKESFGIEIELNTFFHDDFIGEGKFIVFINNISYGIDMPYATTFFCIKDELLKYYSESINADLKLTKYSGIEIARSYYGQNYSNIPLDAYDKDLLTLTKNLLTWSPESAFDDGSYIIQIDEYDKIRLIGFKSCTKDERYIVDEKSITELRIEKSVFKQILNKAYLYLMQFST